MKRWAMAATTAALLVAPAFARESLGVFGQWAAFRDPEAPRCYAIATPPDPNSRSGAFATIAWWPSAGVFGQLHLRFPRALSATYPITLAIGERRFRLRAQGRDAWALSAAADRAILTAMRQERHFGVAARGAGGERLTEGWTLRGAPSALDAAALGCARRG